MLGINFLPYSSGNMDDFYIPFNWMHPKLYSVSTSKFVFFSYWWSNWTDSWAKCTCLGADFCQFFCIQGTWELQHEVFPFSLGTFVYDYMFHRCVNNWLTMLIHCFFFQELLTDVYYLTAISMQDKTLHSKITWIYVFFSGIFWHGVCRCKRCFCGC